MDASDDDSSYVAEADPEEDDKDQSKRRKKEPEVELLKDEELDSLWAEMNTGSAASTKKTVAGTGAAAVKKAAVAWPPAVDVSSLLAELDRSKPQLEKETVKFAGEEVEVLVKSKKKEEGGVAGLIESLKPKATRKINTVQKSELDWEAHKEADKGVQDELQSHMKGQTYLEKVSFLKRAELREYEIERDGKRKK